MQQGCMLLRIQRIYASESVRIEKMHYENNGQKNQNAFSDRISTHCKKLERNYWYELLIKMTMKTNCLFNAQQTI